MKVCEQKLPITRNFDLSLSRFTATNCCQ